ncbi:MAG: hypothetical protein ACK47Q_02220 [Dolichospermum sp.]|jgi:hypothetical protein
MEFKPAENKDAIALETKPISAKPANNKYKTGVVGQASAALMIPPAIGAKLSAISKSYGLPIDLGQISLGESTPDNIKSLRKITDLITGNSKLLPELMKLTNQLLKADIKLSEFHVNLTKSAIKHQEKIDKASADIWLAMAGYGSKSGKLEHRTNTRTALIEKRDAAYAEYYQDSVFGAESKIIDAEYQIASINRAILAESKTKKMESINDRKQKLKAYVDSAFSD